MDLVPKYILNKVFGTEKILFFYQLKQNKANKTLHVLWDFLLSYLCSYFPTCLEWIRTLLTYQGLWQWVLGEQRAHHIHFWELQCFKVFYPTGPFFSLMCKCNSQSNPAGIRSPTHLHYSVGPVGGPLVLAVACPLLACFSCSVAVLSTLAQDYLLPTHRVWRMSKCSWPEHFAEEGYIKYMSDNMFLEPISYTHHRVFTTIS